MAEPIRLQKFFTDCGVLSRRAAEAEIAEGRVLVNGKPAQLGDKIDPENDVVIYRGKRISTQSAEAPRRYIMLNKPRGFVTTAKDEKGRRTVLDLVRRVGTRVYPVGRLDMDSEGLLLLTNDGEFANLLTHPRHQIPKHYRVCCAPTPSHEQISLLRAPMELDGRALIPVEVEKRADGSLSMKLYEGRNRQIRRMCEAVGLRVTELKREAIGELTLGELPLGAWRDLTPEEVRYLIKEETKR